MVPLDVFPFFSVAFGVKFKKNHHQDLCQGDLLIFSSKSFMVSHLVCKSLIHFGLILVRGATQRSSFILLHVAVHFSTPFIKKVSFPHFILLAPLSLTK